MDCNPYLGFAASLACGYIGMKSNAKPRDAVKGVAYEQPRSIPRGLHEALDRFGKNDAVHDVLGREFCHLYKSVKLQEIEEFLQVISPWEREHLLLNV